MNHLATSAAAFGLALLAASCYAETTSVADAHALIYSQLSTDPCAAAKGDAFRPFRVNIPDAALVDLRQRVFGDNQSLKSKSE